MYRKLIISFLFFIISNGALYSQKRDVLAKFIITDARVNGNDATPQLVSNRAYTVIFKDEGDDKLHMSNVWEKAGSESYGVIYSFKRVGKSEIIDGYERDTYHFNWSYNNTYDDKKGTAKVELIKIYKPQGIAFSLKMVTESLDVTVYKGYMEGSLNFK